MNPDTMTVDECREWLALDNGYTPTGYQGQFAMKYSKQEPNGEIAYYADATQPTIDCAARCMPKEFWYKVCVNPNGRVDAYAERAFTSIDVSATDELTARYRLAVKCRMALKTWNE